MSIIHHFLHYSLAHQRPIKVILMPGFTPQCFNLTVTEIEEEGFHYISARNKKTARELRFDDVLAAAYARGDKGETR